MEWTRSTWLRALVIGVLAVYVPFQLTQRDWLWTAVGAVLLVLNLLSWRRRGPSGPVASAPAGGDGPVTAGGVDVTLGELMARPELQEIWGSGPAVWRQVSHLGEGDDLDLPAAEVADHVWISEDDDVPSAQTRWLVAVDDELKPLLDLDRAEEEDPLVAVIAGHPAVAEVMHTDREEYLVVTRTSLTLEEVAELAARGLIAHHREASDRLGR